MRPYSRGSGLLFALAAMHSINGDMTIEKPIKKPTHKDPLTAEQKKRREKEKRAKKTRTKNRNP